MNIYANDITERKKLEDSLKESEERFLFALKKTPVAVGNLDRDLRFTWVYNPQAGYNSEDMTGKKFGTGMNLEDMDSIIACMNEVISKGIPARLEFRGKGLYGEQVYDLYLEPKRSLQNEITGISFTALNITERKKTEEALRKSEEEYSSLFANMIDGFAYCQMIFDEKGKPVDFVYLQVNDAFEKITGLKRDAVIGKRVTVAIPGTEKANPELFEIYGRVALTCKEEKFEMFFKPFRKWFSISVYCPQKGYFAAVFEDTTERKQTQNKLEEYANQMERLAEERAKKLNDAERLAAIGATAGMVGSRYS